MTPKQRKEEFSKAYVQAIAAACGFTVGTWSQDHGCIDVTLRSPEKASIDLQLKASSRENIAHGGHLSVQVERTHYDQMRAERVSQPHYLVLLWMPKDEDAWLSQSQEELVLRKCAYYVLMTGKPPATADDPTVQVPLSQVFTAQALKSIMEASYRGDHLNWTKEENDED
ncbi:MAG: DUF4365 domain-containing protein [Myxococcales bacterium]|nr:DUF4365 domain-containing protein [Myxococcales bacterium]MCB9702379.1 DUF4365 domain-containing protein [Myxococcales bacterium]